MSNGKTIKQIADEIGVSKQAVHQKRKKEPLLTALQPFTKTVDGVIYISVEGENIIKSAFSKSASVDGIDDNERAPVDGIDDNKSASVDGVDNNERAPVDAKIHNDFNIIIDILQKQLEIKDKQLTENDKHIEELTSIIKEQAVNIAQLADQAQKLQLTQLTIQEAPYYKNKCGADPIEPEAPTSKKDKKGFFSRFFKK